MRNLVDTGLDLGESIVGLVSELECREAGRFGGYTWRQWERLKRREQVDLVAHYRLHGLIDLHRGDALLEHQRAQTRKSQRR